MSICPVASVSCLAFSERQLESAQEHRRVDVGLAGRGGKTLVLPSASHRPSSSALAAVPRHSQNCYHFAGELLSSGNTNSLFRLMDHMGPCGKMQILPQETE